MNIKKYIVVLGIVSIAFGACNNDDDDQAFPQVQLRDVAEQSIADNSRLQGFLKTHFYNYEDFENKPDGFNNQIVFDTISGENINKTSLFKQIGDKVIATTVNLFGADHTVYVLKAREGAGEAVSFADSAFVNYKGIAFDELAIDNDLTTVFGIGDTFDSSITPVWFDLTGNVPGFGMGLNGFKGASLIEKDPETGFLVPVGDYGIGAVFMPSRLAYFNENRTGSSYQSLIFTFEVMAGKILDHDGDGKPSNEEDGNGNLFLFDDDEDGDNNADFLDSDTK